ncbi:MAG TPA: hypothetical protein VGP92_14565 [Acidimicrobiia bacterium]|jgi:hypothetical protein|nr:hypothetical protein [Acidimicrobiia bacterium]
MVHTGTRREAVAWSARARLVLIGALGSLLLLGALNSADPAASASQNQPTERTSFVVQHAATVSANASSSARSNRLVVPGALLVLTCLAATASRRLASRRRHMSRRRVEQFHVRLRGPPFLPVAL